MAGESLTYFDYMKEAFSRQVKVGVLGSLPINKMAVAALAVLGLANPGFWFLGAAVEIAFLVMVAGNERFQNLVKAERLQEVQRDWEGKVQRTVGQLSKGSRERYRRLLAQCRNILGISATLDGDSLGGIRDLRAGGLNQILSIFLRLLTSREVIQTNLSGVARQELERDIARLEKELAAVEVNAPLARSLGGTLDIQRKRLENLTRASDNLRVIDAELARIEQQVELIREESAVSGSPESLAGRLDAVTSAMTETSRFLDQHADLFATAESDEGRMPDLPKLPPMLEE